MKKSPLPPLKERGSHISASLKPIGFYPSCRYPDTHIKEFQKGVLSAYITSTSCPPGGGRSVTGVAKVWREGKWSGFAAPFPLPPKTINLGGRAKSRPIYQKINRFKLIYHFLDLIFSSKTPKELYVSFNFDIMETFMYILLCENGQYYTGSTTNLEKRLEQHHLGVGANFTKKHLPVKLVYFETFNRITRLLKGRNKSKIGQNPKRKL